MSTIVFDENKHIRATDGTFSEKENTAPEAVLPVAREPFSDGIQQELFPADWTDADFPTVRTSTDADVPAEHSGDHVDEHTEDLAVIDAYFSQPEPDLDTLEVAASVNILDPATWGSAPF